MFPVFKIIPDKDETHAGSIHVFRMNTDKIYITVVLCLKKLIAKMYPFQKYFHPPFSGQRPHRRFSVCIYSVKWFIFYHHTGSSCTNCMPHPKFLAQKFDPVFTHWGHHHSANRRKYCSPLVYTVCSNFSCNDSVSSLLQKVRLELCHKVHQSHKFQQADQ